VGYLWAILVFLGLSVLDLGPMYATDRQTSDKSMHDCVTSYRILSTVHNTFQKSASHALYPYNELPESQIQIHTTHTEYYKDASA